MKKVVLHYGLFLLVFGAYAYGLSDWSLYAKPSQVFTEIPCLVLVYFLLQLPLRKNRWQPWIGALPILWGYLIHDVRLVMLGSVPDLNEFRMVPDLFFTLGFWQSLGLAVVGALGFVVWLIFVDWTAPFRLGRRLFRPVTLTGIVLVLLVWVSTWIFPGMAYEGLNALTPEEEWSDKVMAQDWGRLYTAWMRELRRRNFLDELEDFAPLEQSDQWMKPALVAHIDRRNVHFVVLESFVDVRQFANLTFDHDPFDPRFSAWADAFLGTSISPVFGGETARAEFEFFCGLPSLRTFGVEFLAFSGVEGYCLPTRLKAAGYHSILSFPHGPVFYNTRRAYPGLGFDQLVWADRFSEPGQESIPIGDVDYLSDGELYDDNLKKVERLLAEGRPFLNYVLTISGHWPFDLDPQREPLVIGVQPDEPDLVHITNFMWYRTGALFQYVRRLVELDPHALVVLVSDHLPPLEDGARDYARLGYRSRAGLEQDFPDQVPFDNLLLVVREGKPVRLPRMHHFDLPHWILNELTGGAYCQEKPALCDFGRLPVVPARYAEDYKTILGLAARQE